MRIEERLVGRPAGQAQQNVEKLFLYLMAQEQPVRSPTAVLVQETGMSKRQVERALLTLKRSSRVSIRHQKAQVRGSWCNKRMIYVQQEE